MKRRLLRNSRGFTLIELMVVVIIVGILASVAIPLYRSNVRKAAATEGAAFLGSLLTQERVYYAENSTYSSDVAATGAHDVLVDPTGNKYFQSTPTMTGVSASGFSASVNSTIGAANGVTVQMVYTNTAGATISYSGL
jgi:prepilin-type N-terminal cleavage/methylation domain-containing protein